MLRAFPVIAGYPDQPITYTQTRGSAIQCVTQLIGQPCGADCRVNTHKSPKSIGLQLIRLFSENWHILLMVVVVKISYNAAAQ